MLSREIPKLREDSYPMVESAMLHEPEYRMVLAGGNRFVGRPFQHQLLELITGETPPDAIVLTAKSAVPLADAFRGFYEGMDLETPLLTHVEAGRALVWNLREVPAVAQRTIGPELERLSGVLEGKTAPCVVDEFLASGRTLNLAMDIVRRSRDFDTVHSVSGRWYKDVAINDVDVVGLTSRHAKFMHGIGQKAAEMVRERAANE